MRTKYNWSIVPVWVEYITTDRNGTVTGWDGKPVIAIDIWAAGREVRHSQGMSQFDVEPFTGWWWMSCEKRPENRPVSSSQPDFRQGLVAA